MSADGAVRAIAHDEQQQANAKIIAKRGRAGDSALGKPVDHGPVGEKDQTTYYDEVLKIPGYGDAPSRCRPLTPVGFCMEGHPILGRSSCGARYCPDHWRDWAESATISVVARLAAWRHAHAPQASHVVASPPQGRYSQRAVWERRSDSYDALTDAGVRGGACVAHPYAATEGAKELYGTARESGDLPESTGIWRFLREMSDDWEDLSRHIEGRPHYHAIAPTGEVEPADAPDGWVVKRIRNFQPFYYDKSEGYEDMAATVYYVLTHAAVQEGRQSTTYFGDVHPASFDPEETLTAAVWDRIQREAVKAVKERPDREGDVPTHGPADCPRDGCEADVRPFRRLREMLDDEEWVSAIRTGREGRQRWLRLRGMLYWWGERGDRPPPGIQGSRARLLEWLEDRGRASTPAARQTGLGRNSADFGV